MAFFWSDYFLNPVNVSLMLSFALFFRAPADRGACRSECIETPKNLAEIGGGKWGRRTFVPLKFRPSGGSSRSGRDAGLLPQERHGNCERQQHCRDDHEQASAALASGPKTSGLESTELSLTSRPRQGDAS